MTYIEPRILLELYCHAIDSLRWFAGDGEFNAATPVEVFAYSGGWRKSRDIEYDYYTMTWKKDAPPLEYDGLEVMLVKFEGGLLGKVSVNFDTIMPYTFPIEIFGDKGSIKDKESHCNLENAMISHEIAFAAMRCYETKQPVKLPLMDR